CNYAALPDCQVVAIPELRPELRRKVAARYGVTRVYRDHRQLLAAEKGDALVNIQSFVFHGQFIPELLAAGVPLRTEKPIATPDPKPPAMTDAQFTQYLGLVNYYIHQVNLMRHLIGDFRVTHADPAGVLMIVRGNDNGVTGTIEMAPWHNTLDWQESVLVTF